MRSLLIFFLNAFRNTAQIAAKLADNSKLNITDGTGIKLGKALKKHGYPKRKVMSMQFMNTMGGIRAEEQRKRTTFSTNPRTRTIKTPF